jgi:hypothetical protein
MLLKGFMLILAHVAIVSTPEVDEVASNLFNCRLIKALVCETAFITLNERRLLVLSRLVLFVP